MSDQKITIGNVCFLIDKEKNKVLLLERNAEPMKGMFTGVGGKTKFDEDIQASCAREVKEETGFEVTDLKLKGVIKTLLDGYNSSWILFVYISDNFSGEQIKCPEGELKWIDIDKVYDVNLIGFIKEILPHILRENSMIEGTIVHDMRGEVLSVDIQG